jgi:hypothetical protein
MQPWNLFPQWQVRALLPDGEAAAANKETSGMSRTPSGGTFVPVCHEGWISTPATRWVLAIGIEAIALATRCADHIYKTGLYYL